MNRSIRIAIISLMALGNMALLQSAHATSQVSFTNSGLLSAYTATAASAWPESLILADLTGDGRQDVGLTTSAYFDAANDDSLQVLSQTVGGGLNPPVGYAAGQRPVAVAAGDLNSDGRSDLAIVLGGENAVGVYLQAVTGTLAPLVKYPAGEEPDSVAVGDFNTDGRDDVVVAHAEAQYIAVYLQTVTGTLAAPVTYPVSSAGFNELAVGDLDGDGDDDVALLRGAGFAADQIAVFYQQNGVLAGPIYRTVTDGGLSAHGIAVGDVTGDGRDDIVVVAGGIAPDAYLNVLPQLPGGSIAITPTVYAAVSLPEAVEIGDLNHDGRNDVVAVHGAQQTLSVYLQNTSGGFLPYETYPLPYVDGYNPHGLDLGDLNGDGGLDVAIADHANGLVVLRNTVSAPVAAIVNPARFGYVISYTTYTVSGTVTGATQVQVSTDGGQTWESATVTGNVWSYDWAISGGGVYQIKARAVDNSGRVQAPVATARLVVDTVITLSIARLNATTARLSWTTSSGATEYHLYRGTTPYFTAADPPYQVISTTSSYDDVGALGNTNTNYFYVLKSVCCNGLVSADSNRVGKFEFLIRETSGSDFNWIALPLDASLSMASNLKSHVELNSNPPVTVATVARWNATGQAYNTFSTVPFPIGDFALTLGGAYRINIAVSSGTSATWTLVGNVPASSAFSYPLQETSGSDYNWVMLPLDKTGITLASLLKGNVDATAHPTSTALTISQWNAVGQTYATFSTVPFPIGDFATRFGYPYRLNVDVASGATSTWP